MTISIIGSGTVGSSLARVFANAGVSAMIANTRGPESISIDAEDGDFITPVHLDEALESDVIFAAVPFGAVEGLGRAVDDWTGRIVVDVTNAFGVELEQRGGGTSSELVAEWLSGAKVVKALNHLPYRILESPVPGNGGRRAVFISSDDPLASAAVAELVSDLGFAPVELGLLGEGSRLFAVGGALFLKNLVEYPYN